MAHMVFRALHFVGVILWMGGIIACTAAAVQGASKSTTAASRTVNVRIASPGMVAAFIGGLGMLLPMWGTFYAKQPWMHMKLTLVLAASAISGIISGTLRRASELEEQPVGKLKKLSIAMFCILIAVVLLVIFRPLARPGAV